jgi:hypothetical protein
VVAGPTQDAIAEAIEMPSLKHTVLFLAAGLLVGGCAMAPTGPSVMVLPGSGRSLAQFQNDDAVCRTWAAQQSGTTPSQAATRSGVTAAAIGTGVGAVLGTAIGAAVGDLGAGAAIGAGSGLLMGTLTGSERGDWAGASVQSRYDNAYLQCMYANGNQIPVARDSFQTSAAPSFYSPPRAGPSRYVPPPPLGPPPPPPPR